MGANGSCCSCEDDTGNADLDDHRRLKRDLRKRLPGEFTVVVDRRMGEGLGIDASPERDGTLEIRNVQADGLVFRWNERQPPGASEVVKKGMQIVEVNGVSSGALQLIQACKECSVLHIVVAPKARYDEYSRA
mmetsp:Transcript_66713/g.124636  ORF Transcript_66713/g.124636 Transcript_66713/m.124636 type:complete len:133 (+) Transcript_66713:59-457(+)